MKGKKKKKNQAILVCACQVSGMFPLFLLLCLTRPLCLHLILSWGCSIVRTQCNFAKVSSHCGYYLPWTSLSHPEKYWQCTAICILSFTTGSHLKNVYIQVSVGISVLRAREASDSPWSWSYRGDELGYWEQHYTLLTAEPSLQLPVFLKLSWGYLPSFQAQFSWVIFTSSKFRCWNLIISIIVETWAFER